MWFILAPLTHVQTGSMNQPLATSKPNLVLIYFVEEGNTCDVK